MGKDENITNETFERAAEAMGLSSEESKKNAVELLEKVLASKEQSTDKNWIPGRS